LGLKETEEAYKLESLISELCLATGLYYDINADAFAKVVPAICAWRNSYRARFDVAGDGTLADEANLIAVRFFIQFVFPQSRDWIP